MRDASDAAQARVFYDWLAAEADALDAALRTQLTRRGLPRATTEARLLSRDLDEVRRCMSQLRARFPDLDARPAEP
ncbi:hypothetical protein BJY24_005456 [Nocardia transvalensis]|uniref:Uncharacterized protein n=1 Tax=Nocardia transvalensis TaxID=37333 RepID=A0A7W9PJ27_9NOCA|nr:hypothetical protein [Nocardia transvalensis]MBB5916544.1 hypothetical protein [Nocardia transvalensis]